MPREHFAPEEAPSAKAPPREDDPWPAFLREAGKLLETDELLLVDLDAEGGPRDVLARADETPESAAGLPAWVENALAAAADRRERSSLRLHDASPASAVLAEVIRDCAGEPLAGLVARRSRSDEPDRAFESGFESIAEVATLGLRGQRELASRLGAENLSRQTEKLAAVGKLATGIAHDFNNLLTVIQGHASLLETSLKDTGAAERSAESLGLIRSASRQAVALSRQLLLFTRDHPADTSECELNEIAEEFVKMMRRMVEESIDITFEPGDDLPPIRANPSCIGQILMNLIVNARDAMPEGGSITIRTETVAAEPGEASKEDLEGRDQVALTVTDSGKGIPEDQLARIFDPFFTTKEEGEGTGLGLATVATIVREHEGHIDVSSTPGEGTSFELRFPSCERRAAPAPTPEAPSGEETIEGSTVLLVEDESAVRKLVRKLLELHGCEVIEAASGRQALDLWPGVCEDVSVVVSDVVMPEGVSGWDLAGELRDRNPEVAILLTSGYDERPDEHGFGDERGIAFLQKPYESGNLKLELSKLLRSA